MPSCGKLLIASLGAAYVRATYVAEPRWVLGKTNTNCHDVCDQALDKHGEKMKCEIDRPAPKSEAEFRAILDNIKDDDGNAKCDHFIDSPTLKGPSISRGVCWYSSKLSQFDC